MSCRCVRGSQLFSDLVTINDVKCVLMLCEWKVAFLKPVTYDIFTIPIKEIWIQADDVLRASKVQLIPKVAGIAL